MSDSNASSQQKTLLKKYVDAVMHAPGSLQLTATTSEVEFWERHVLDALSLLQILPKDFHGQNLKVLDVGSGNGIPGIPAAIAMPQWQVFLLDSNNKKSGFLDMFCKFNTINNVHVLPSRAETLAHQATYRSQFDLVYARALSKLPTALELTVPFLKVGGLLVVPQGSTYKAELANSENALHELKASLNQILPYQVGKKLNFTALLFKKDQETPERYPRKEGTPKKNPL
jgi:16S rRNA (guanine527-N7)-methyltransferase